MFLGSLIILNVFEKPNHTKYYWEAKSYYMLLGSQIMLNIIGKPNQDKYYPSVERHCAHYNNDF